MNLQEQMQQMLGTDPALREHVRKRFGEAEVQQMYGNSLSSPPESSAESGWVDSFVDA